MWGDHIKGGTPIEQAKRKRDKDMRAGAQMQRVARHKQTEPRRLPSHFREVNVFQTALLSLSWPANTKYGTSWSCSFFGSRASAVTPR
jgi:hypothetical protein